MSLDEETLQNVARDGEMDYSKWPNIVDPLLERLNDIICNDFSIPRPYTNISLPLEPDPPINNRTETNTEQIQPPSTPVRNLPPVPLFPQLQSSATPSTDHVPDSLPPSQNVLPPSSSSSNPIDQLPLPLVQLLTGITSTLRTAFSTRPPHTVQRLAELILNPTKHYRTLPAWLRAVDRVVNVSSSADIFPLSEGQPVTNGVMSWVNGEGGGGILWHNDVNETRNGFDRDSLGSDESLGGALLTPIPWLRSGPGTSESQGSSSGATDTEESGEGIEALETTASAPASASADATANVQATTPMVTLSHDPLVPPREDGAVTQGELIRMEQEAGVVPVSTSRPLPMAEADEMEFDGADDQVPHARGPDVVGVEDMGMVDGKEVEVRIGSGSPEEVKGKATEVKKLDSPPDSEKWEIVGREEKEDEGEDVNMAMGSPEKGGDIEKKGKGEGQDDSEDIVLVDADGKMEDTSAGAGSGTGVVAAGEGMVR